MYKEQLIGRINNQLQVQFQIDALIIALNDYQKLGRYITHDRLGRPNGFYVLPIRP